MAWKVFATAPDQLIGESWCGLVEAAGIRCQLQPGDVVGFMGVSIFPVRLMVQSEEVESAQAILENLVGEDEQPTTTTDKTR